MKRATNRILIYSDEYGEEVFKSVSDAARFFGVPRSTMDYRAKRNGQFRFVYRELVGTDADGNEHRYPTIEDAAKGEFIDSVSIRLCLSGRYKTAAGLKWRWEVQNDRT